MLIDTHAHLYAGEFDDDRDAMMERAFAQGVQKMMLPNVDSHSIEGMLRLEAAYPGRCYAMMGLHPCSVKDDYVAELAVVEGYLGSRPFRAVGEIGLDYYWSLEHVVEQKAAFRLQIGWAKELDLPIVIHARDSLDDILELVTEEKTERLRGIFHCFGGTVEQARRIADLGFLMGIGGVLTFKKSGLDQTLLEVGLEHLVLETDAPYLAPVPFRGKRNESAYTALVAQRLAVVKGVSVAEVAEVTTGNALRIFDF